MPDRPPSRCSALDCDEYATSRGRCTAHQRKRRMGIRGSFAGDGRDTHRWRNESRAFLRSHPRCARCDAPSTDTDHIVEIADGGAMWDHANWQSLCHPCHVRKTKEQARKRAARLAKQRQTQHDEPSLTMRLWNQLP